MAVPFSKISLRKCPQRIIGALGGKPTYVAHRQTTTIWVFSNACDKPTTNDTALCSSLKPRLSISKTRFPRNGVHSTDVFGTRSSRHRGFHWATTGAPNHSHHLLQVGSSATGLSLMLFLVWQKRGAGFNKPYVCQFTLHAKNDHLLA